MKFKESVLKVEGEEITVRELSAKQRQTLFELHNSETNPIEIQANIISMGCEAFVDTSIDEIGDLPGSYFDSIAKGVLKVSGLDDDAEAEAEKN